jgi:hypothetical protein
VLCTALLTWACAAPGSDDGLAAATAGSAGGGRSGAEVARLTLPTQDTVPRDSVADLPHATADARPVPVTGKTIRVGPRGNLQSALNRAQPGDAVLLAPGATYEGNFTLPTRRCAADAWITVRTDTPDDSLPAEGERITPAFSSRLAKISTPNAQPALKTANPTCQWRLFALEITGTLPKSTIQYGLVLMGVTDRVGRRRRPSSAFRRISSWIGCTYTDRRRSTRSAASPSTRRARPW